jgi:hypothetical protein
MTLHEFMTTALNHPLQMLCIGMVVVRVVHAAVSAVRDRQRVRLRFAHLRRPPTPARVAV